MKTEYFDSSGRVPVHQNAKACSPVRQRRFYSMIGKRVFDLALALLIAPLILPVVLALCLLVRRDGGSAFFGHTRVGLKGQPFKCWKIRTMQLDAEEHLRSYLAANPEAREEWDRDRKLTNDPRITPIGRFLRETSLDELPQIWNVLRGEMSFVGPRPVVRDEMRLYGRRRSSYLVLRPGVTGLWQTSGRNDVSYEERVAMDCEYQRTISFSRDLGILMKTVSAVLGRTGS